MILSAANEYQYTNNCTVFDEINVDRVTGIALSSSSITITHSQFEGNNVGRIGAVISIEFGSDLVIINSTFINNHASGLYYILCAYYCHGDCTSGIVHTSGHGSSVKIYDSKFMQNEGDIVYARENFNMLITHTRFMNNVCNYSSGCVAIVFVTDSNLVISHSTYNNNIGSMLIAHHTEVSIRHSEFLCNNGSFATLYFVGVITTIDHSKFINNTSPQWILIARSTEVSISYSEFLYNNGGLDIL